MLSWLSFLLSSLFIFFYFFLRFIFLFETRPPIYKIRPAPPLLFQIHSQLNKNLLQSQKETVFQETLLLMASISSLIILTFCLSAVGLQNSESLLTFSHENPNNTLIFTAVRTFVYFLVPLTFTLATLLLHFHLTISNFQHIPMFASFFKNFTMATQAFAVATLLLGAVLMAISSIPSNQGIDQAIWAGVACLAAVLIQNSLKGYLKLGAVYESPLFVLCISVGAFLLSEQLLSYNVKFPYNPLIHIPIHLLTYLQIPTFFLGTILLLIRIAMPRLSIDPLDLAVQAMIFTTLLTGLYSMVYLGVAAIGGGGGAMEIGLS